MAWRKKQIEVYGGSLEQLFFKEDINDLAQSTERNESTESEQNRNDKGEQALTEISVVEV